MLFDYVVNIKLYLDIETNLKDILEETELSCLRRVQSYATKGDNCNEWQCKEVCSVIVATEEVNGQTGLYLGTQTIQ